MKPKLIALNLILIAAFGAMIWQARVRYREAERLRSSLPPTRPVAVQVAPAPKPEAPAATKYEDVAKKNLFSADRNADIVVEAPKVEAPKPMPALPVVFGVMSLPSGIKASMAEKAGERSKIVRTGDSIGEFKIVALDAKNVTFEWNGKEVPRRIEDLIDRSNQQVASNAAAPAAPAPGAPAPPPKPPTEANLGKEMTPSSRACTPGDSSAIGSVAGGYKKVGQETPFGIINCHWEKQ